MKEKYPSVILRNSIESIPFSSKHFPKSEYRSDGEVGYTTTRKRVNLSTKKKEIIHDFDMSVCEKRYEDDRRFYLTDPKVMASYAAIDIDLCSQGKKEDSFEGNYEALRGLIKIVQTNIIPGRDIDNAVPDYMSKEFIALIKATGRNSGKERPLKVAQCLSTREWDDSFRQLTSSDIMLELRLLYMELRDFESLPEERLKTLGSFCVDFSKELAMVEESHKRYAAVA